LDVLSCQNLIQVLFGNTIWDSLSTMQYSYDDEKAFLSEVEARIDNGIRDFSKTLNIAVIGKVSSGKSSFINALLRRDRSDILAPVGAQAGTTIELNAFLLGDQVRLVDSPGLDDIRAERSEVTIDFLKHIDVGILIVSGAADDSQNKHLIELSKHCKSIFVVLNKINEFDDYDPTVLVGITDQWEEMLDWKKVYPVCTLGYDPSYRKDLPLRIEGVFQVRKDIEDFLAQSGKDLLLARHMGKKQDYATKIILTAVVATAAQVVIPGAGAAAVMVTQSTAIATLHFVYTGKPLKPKAVLTLIPTFTTHAAFPTAFLWLQSFLPPTGLVDVIAAGTAASMTLAILLTVNFFLESGEELNERKNLQEKFKHYRQTITDKMKESNPKDFTKREYWIKLIADIMGKS
jgi:GTP-binding protein EngB required for normal cell division